MQADLVYRKDCMPDRRRLNRSSYLFDYCIFVCIKQVFKRVDNRAQPHIGRRNAHV